MLIRYYIDIYIALQKWPWGPKLLPFCCLLSICLCLTLWVWQTCSVLPVPAGAFWLLLRWGFALHLAMNVALMMAFKDSLYSPVILPTIDYRLNAGRKQQAYLPFCSSLLTVWYSHLPLVLQKPSSAALLLRWTQTSSLQCVAKDHSRARLGNGRLLPLRSGLRKSVFKKIGEMFQQNLILLWRQSRREQHKKMD